MLKQISNHRNGFTIVELLIVIVIIAILAGLTVVAFNGIRQRAALSSVKSDTIKLAKAIELQKAEGALPTTVDSTASTLPNMKVSGSNQVTKYTVSGSNYRACVISYEGGKTTSYAIYDSASNGIIDSGTGSGPTVDCTPPPPEFVNGIRCPVITFGTPFSLDATTNRVRVTYSDATISRIDGIGGSPVDGSGSQYVYIDQGALDRYDFPKASGINWNATPIGVRGTDGRHRYDCTITFYWAPS